jgi:hypothetical protein
MQIRVLEGNPDVFNALIYGEQPTVRTFLHDQLTNFSATLTSAGQQFMQGARDVFDKIANSGAAQTARAILRQTGVFFDPNMIVAIDNLQGLQHAGVGMQRWIMAQPDIRDLYHKQLVDGYADSYIDLHPGCVGNQHYDYRRVMDGVIQEAPEGADYDWETVQYLDDLIDGDVVLSISDKADILSTWDIVKMYAEARKEDPTNPFGGTIG